MNIPFLSGSGKSVLGVDIGTSALKIVELEFNSQGLKVVTVHVSSITPGLIKQKYGNGPGKERNTYLYYA